MSQIITCDNIKRTRVNFSVITVASSSTVGECTVEPTAVVASKTTANHAFISQQKTHAKPQRHRPKRGSKPMRSRHHSTRFVYKKFPFRPALFDCTIIVCTEVFGQVAASDLKLGLLSWAIIISPVHKARSKDLLLRSYVALEIGPVHGIWNFSRG